MDDIAALRSALAAEPALLTLASKDKIVFGNKVSLWIDKVLKKVVAGVYDIGTGVVSGLLSNAIARYYGL